MISFGYLLWRSCYSLLSPALKQTRNCEVIRRRQRPYKNRSLHEAIDISGTEFIITLPYIRDPYRIIFLLLTSSSKAHRPTPHPTTTTLKDIYKMATGSNDPRMLYSINNIRAFHLQDGEESDLTPSGPQTLSLLMVPTSNTPANAESTGAPAEEDFYLHLHLPPELDLPLPATTQIYHQPPTSYLIPRWDLGPESGAFTRIEFPAIGSAPDKASQEDIDTFETILAQCTAFLERAGPPKEGHHAYNPADFAPGEGYIGTGGEKPGGKGEQQPGQIVIVDEENGSVVGELTEGYNVVETDIKPGSKSTFIPFSMFWYTSYIRNQANILGFI